MHSNLMLTNKTRTDIFIREPADPPWGEKAGNSLADFVLLLRCRRHYPTTAFTAVVRAVSREQCRIPTMSAK